jgi:hypothetical protein
MGLALGITRREIFGYVVGNLTVCEPCPSVRPLGSPANLCQPLRRRLHADFAEERFAEERSV